MLAGILSGVHALVVAAVTGVLVHSRPDYLTVWANTLGLMAAALAAIQYLPQIWTTWRLKHIGSLSIPMMLIQTPGGYLWAASLFARLGWAGWSTWFIYLMTASMQGCLLAMAIYFELSARRRNRENNNYGQDNGSPQSPLNRSNRPPANRAYSEGWERGLPGPFTGHPEQYAENEDDLDDMREREERAIARESQPLLRPGGIGHPKKSYDSTEQQEEH